MTEPWLDERLMDSAYRSVMRYLDGAMETSHHENASKKRNHKTNLTSSSLIKTKLIEKNYLYRTINLG